MREFHLGNSKFEIMELLPESRIKKVNLGHVEIGIVRLGEHIFGFHSFCPHRGASLMQGSINASGELICPLHHYRFELTTGRVKSGNCADLQTFPCTLTESGLKITIP